MAVNFSTFVDKCHRRPVTARVRINKKGTLAFNERAIDLLGRPEHVEFLFDADSRTLGIRGASKTVYHAYAVQCAGSVRPRVHAKAVFNLLGILPEAPVVVENLAVDKGVLIVPLANAQPVPKAGAA